MTLESGSSIAEVSISRHLFSREAVLNTAYRYGAVFDVDVDEDGTRWKITLTPKQDSPNPDSLDQSARFRSDLVDFQLRHELEQSFRPIRDRIVATAFGHDG